MDFRQLIILLLDRKHCYLSDSNFSFEQVHLDYLEAGADIILTASYQVIRYYLKVKMNVLLWVCICETELYHFSN